MTTLFDLEEISRAYGRTQREEEKEEQAKKIALYLYKTGMEQKQIVVVIDYGLETVEKWLRLQTA